MSGTRKRKGRRKDAPKLPVWVEDCQRIWSDALNDLRHELSDHCRTSKPDKLRFQDRRLSETLWERLKIAAGEDQQWRNFWMFRCYSFITNFGSGYEEPRRLHWEEMKAVGLQDSPRSFFLSWTKRFRKYPLETFKELKFRVHSIVSWVEAQESVSTWLAFNDNRAFWRGDPDAMARAFQAWILATLNRHLGVYEFKGRQVIGAKLWEGLGVGTNFKGVPWNFRQWANILEQAARLAKKRHNNCTPLEYWVWWCYPIFSRYGWNAREVSEAASARGFDGAIFDKEVADFRRYWMSRGLRFAGRKTKRRTPPLAEFVRDIALPNLDSVCDLVGWFPLRKKTDRT